MNEKEIVDELVNYIIKAESKTGEISLFEWSHLARCKLADDYGIKDLNTRRRLYIEAYNITHPKTPYEYRPK